MILKKALGDLTPHSMRTLLVVLSTAVGVFGVSGIKLFGEQIERGATEKFNGSNPADLTVDTSAVTAAKRDRLRDVSNVRTVEGRVVATARWKPPQAGARKENTHIQG